MCDSCGAQMIYSPFHDGYYCPNCDVDEFNDVDFFKDPEDFDDEDDD